MDDVILKGGGKEILDIDRYFLLKIKDLEYVNNSKLKKKNKKYKFYLVCKLISVYWWANGFSVLFKKFKMEKPIEDYKKGKIFKKMNNDFGYVVKKFCNWSFKNGIYSY